MARSVKEIYNTMVTEKEQMPTLASELLPTTDSHDTLLTDLNSNSKVAIWRMLFYVIAVAIWVHESLWDKFKIELDAIRNEFIPGTVDWYRLQAFEYQYGSSVIKVKNKYVFDSLDLSKRIIKYCAVTDSSTVTIKVAKDSSGTPTPLTNEELASFHAYMYVYRRFAGITLNIISAPPDVLKLYATIYFNPLFILADLTLAVERAITSYIATLPFNGIMLNSQLVDAIQAVAGVLDVALDSVQAHEASSSTWLTVTRIYSPFSGYIRIDTDTPLNTSIQYMPYV